MDPVAMMGKLVFAKHLRLSVQMLPGTAAHKTQDRRLLLNILLIDWDAVALSASNNFCTARRNKVLRFSWVELYLPDVKRVASCFDSCRDV